MTTYLDAEGNELTKEEYEEMQAKGLKKKKDLKDSLPAGQAGRQSEPAKDKEKK